MDKIFRAIGNFFKKIWEWIKTTAWVQPLLIVGIIFGIIFAIQPTYNGIKGCIDSTDSGEFYKDHLVKLNGLFAGIDNQSPAYDESVKNEKYKANKDSGDILVIYVDDKTTLEDDVVSFYKSAIGESCKGRLYVVSFGYDVNKKSEYDKDKKDYKNDSGATYYDFLLEQFQSAYNVDNENPESLNSNFKFGENYNAAFEAQYGYSIFYSDFGDTYNTTSENKNSAHTDLRFPAAVKYHNGEVVDMRFANNGSWKGYQTNITDTNRQSNIQVLSDLWKGVDGWDWETGSSN